MFAVENTTLWDFGVIITSVQQNTPNKDMQSLTKLEEDTPPQFMALIANPFIPPTKTSIDKKISVPPILLDKWERFTLNNIKQVQLLTSQLTLQLNYQSVIDIIGQMDLNQIDDNDKLDLNYWLANAFFHIGAYSKAEDIILSSIGQARDDRFYFLLAMTYEEQDKIQAAQKKYLQLIKQFPNSDYQVTALIKTRMLGRR